MDHANIDQKTLLSTLWIFVTANYIFCDIFTLMHGPELEMILNGYVGDTQITEGFLLTFAFIMELPMLMIILSRILKHDINRIGNMFVALLMTLVQVGSLFVGKLSLHYIFFSAIEIPTTILILVIAFNWSPKKMDAASQ